MPMVKMGREFPAQTVFVRYFVRLKTRTFLVNHPNFLKNSDSDYYSFKLPIDLPVMFVKLHNAYIG